MLLCEPWWDVFFLLAASSLASVCIYGLWNEAVRGKSRRTMEEKMAVSMCLLNWTVPLVSFRLVLSCEVEHRLRSHTHTHKHTDKWASLAFCLSHHCRHPDKPLWFHMQAHICDCYARWVFAGTWRQISHCLFVECICTLHMPVHICVQWWVFSIKHRNQQSFLEQSGDKDAFSQIFTPCSAEYIIFAWVNGCIDEKDLLLPPLIPPPGLFAWLWPCNAITDHLGILEIILFLCSGVVLLSMCILHLQ